MGKGGKAVISDDVGLVKGWWGQYMTVVEGIGSARRKVGSYSRRQCKMSSSKKIVL